MGIFSKIHAYVLIKTRREFIHLRRLLMKRRQLLEILEIGLTMPKFTLHFFVTLLKNSTDKISLTKRLYILKSQR